MNKEEKRDLFVAAHSTGKPRRPRAAERASGARVRLRGAVASGRRPADRRRRADRLPVGPRAFAEDRTEPGCGMAEVSDTEEMVRVMDHAAAIMRTRVDAMMSTKTANHQVTIAEFRDAAALMYGRAVLEMVAASVAPSGRSQARNFLQQYNVWAEANEGVTLLDGELDSVARFLRSQREES